MNAAGGDTYAALEALATRLGKIDVLLGEALAAFRRGDTQGARRLVEAAKRATDRRAGGVGAG